MPDAQSGYTSGISADTAGRIVLDAGVLYRNYGQVGQQRIGATRGGATFVVDRQERDIPVDGAHGPVQGLTRVVGTTVTLEATLVELADQTFLDVLRGTQETNGARTRIVGDTDIVDADYYLNVTLVAPDLATGAERVLMLRNVLAGAGGWRVQTRDRGEWGMDVRFRAHFRTSDLDTPPYQEGLLAGLLRDWYPDTGSGQTLDERIYEKDGELGSTSGADANDPAWGSSPPTLTYDEDDYVTEASTPWSTS